jgi:hypothetical protein
MHSGATLVEATVPYALREPAEIIEPGRGTPEQARAARSSRSQSESEKFSFF